MEIAFTSSNNEQFSVTVDAGDEQVARQFCDDLNLSSPVFAVKWTAEIHGDEYETCPACRGTGSTGSRNHLICDECHGSGVAE